MALVGDMLTGNATTVAAVDATAVLRPRRAPAFPAPLCTAPKSGLKLAIESDEGGIADKLADTAMQNAPASLSGPGTAEGRRQASQAAVQPPRRPTASRQFLFA